MLYRVSFVVVCILGLLWVFGSKLQQKPPQQKMSGTVTGITHADIKSSAIRLEKTKKTLEMRLRDVLVPKEMVKNGKLQKLSADQRRMFAILTVFFENDPIMVRVAACESSLQHTLPDGSLNVGPDGYDIGTFMVRAPVHERELRRYGLDPTNFTHNVAFATYLYERDGLRPWQPSRSCWETLRFIT
jgi:hypothetical protein